ncbi:MAG: YggT family protein [Variibacter sp.]|nr:YggT family protein [Variibacter sp.]
MSSGRWRQPAAERRARRIRAGLVPGGEDRYISLAHADRSPMIELLRFISYLLTLYVYILIAMAVLSWLIAFNVVNMRHPVVDTIGRVLYRLTEPVLAPIRRRLPSMGGIDLSPVIVILIIFFIQSVILPNIAKAFI